MIFWKKWQAKSKIEQQIQQHLPMLERIVASYESRHALQQELLQEVVLAIWQAVDKFQGDASIKTYMARIAQNRCITHVDKAVRTIQGDEWDEQIAIADESYSQQQQRDQQWQRLMQQVRTLPLAQKQVISLMLEGFSYKQIADICGLTESNVGVLINRGKAVLQQQIQGEV